MRAKGLIIEAHEVLSGKRWDEPGGTVGIKGAIAKALGNTKYDEDELGTDIAAGYIVDNPEPDHLEDALNMLGPEMLALFIESIS